MKTREEILKAADSLFGEVGFDATSIRRIAELSGVNKGLIHYHFKNKEALFCDVLDNYYTRLNETYRQVFEVEGMSLRERVKKIFDVHSDYLVDNHGFSRIVQREAAGGQRMDRILKHVTPIFERLAGMIEAEYAHVRVGPLSASHFIISLFGMVVGYFTYGDVVEKLTGMKPMGKQDLEVRKAHIREMVDLYFDRLEKEDV